MRRPTVGRLIAASFAVTLVILIAIDTTMACRFFSRHHVAVSYVSDTCCPPVVSCPPVDCGPTIICGEVIGSSCSSVPYETTVDSSCCGGETVISGPVEGTITSPSPTPPTPPTSSAAPTAPTPPTQLEPTPAVEENGDELMDDSVDEAAAEEPLDDSDDVLPPAEAGEDEMFDDLETPADDLPADDLPADDAPADDSDLFGDPADDVAPPADAPADDAADDLFGGDDAAGFEEAPAPADDALPGFDDPAPTDAPPADTPPADDADSLDDLFGSNGANREPEPRMARQPESGDDLFDGLDATPASTESPAPADEANPVDDLDDLFGTTPAPAPTKPVSSETDELPFRIWTDNTGQYQTVGKLVQISPTQIRLLKDNGRFSTVSKERLSQADLAYVTQMETHLGVLDQLVVR
jgi:hypothetical protein